MSQFILVVGNPIAGLVFYGPFDDENACIEYAEGHKMEQWWVAPLAEREGWEGMDETLAGLLNLGKRMDMSAELLPRDDDPRYTVDGHEFDSEESDLAGDGQFPPFRVFNVNEQDYLSMTFQTREDAQRVADAINAECGK